MTMTMIAVTTLLLLSLLPAAAFLNLNFLPLQQRTNLFSTVAPPHFNSTDHSPPPGAFADDDVEIARPRRHPSNSNSDREKKRISSLRHRDRNLREMNYRLDALVRARNISAAETLYRETVNATFPNDRFSFNIMLNCYSKHSPNMSTALSFFDSPKNTNIKDIISYQTILSGFIRRKQLTEAISWFKNMRNVPNLHLTRSSYNSIIDGLGRNNHIDEAEHWFTYMNTLNPPLKPDIITYSTMISNLFKQNRPECALKYFDLMLANKIAPNSIVLSNLVAMPTDSTRS